MKYGYGIKETTSYSNIKLSMGDILQASNIAELLDADQLTTIALKVIEEYYSDEDSRSGWLNDMKSAMELALQVTEAKNVPWKNAANVKLPIITIAALQFNSRVLPAIVSGNTLVKMKTIGRDNDGRKLAKAKRVETFMSYQMLEEDRDWVEEMDSMLMSLPIIGCGFKKVYQDTDVGAPLSKFVKPENLCIDYYATSIETAHRITELCDMNHNTVVERQRSGVYKECELNYPSGSESSNHEGDKVGFEGRTPPSLSPGNRRILEQHRYLDLDDDGYMEPYIVVVDLLEEKVLGIYARFGLEDITYSKKKTKQIARIVPEHYYIKYRFVPSPNGSIYDLGWGALLAPINKSINSSVNRMLDAATLANMPFGFLGRMVRVKEGEIRIAPGRFIQLNATGEDLKKHIYMPELKGPSNVLLSLMELLLRYSERVSSTGDMMVGETPGQNTPATTSLAVLEQAQKVLNRTYARVFEGAKKEYRRRFQLNKLHLDVKHYAEVVDEFNIENQDEEQMANNMQELSLDFMGSSDDIKPAADPTVAGEAQRLAKAEAIRKAAYEGTGYDHFEVERRYMEALNVENMDAVLPIDEKGGQAILPPSDPKIEIEKAKLEIESMKLKLEQARVELDNRYKQSKLDAELRLIEAQAIKAEADAIKSIAQAEAAEAGTDIAEYKAHIDLLKQSLSKRKQERVNAEAPVSDNADDVGGMEREPSNPEVQGVPS